MASLSTGFLKKSDDVAGDLYSGVAKKFDETVDPGEFDLLTDGLKKGEIPAGELDELNDALKEIVNNTGSKFSYEQLKKFFKAGKNFENFMESGIKTALTNKSGKLYNDLGAVIDDLDQRRVLKQVQFCVPNVTPPCNSKGSYFVADFVFAKFDNLGNVTDMIILETKLSTSTALSAGQKLAKTGKGGNLLTRSTTIENDLFGNKLQKSLSQGTSAGNKRFLEGRNTIVPDPLPVDFNDFDISNVTINAN